jgi:phosphoribosylglycinamide formyltransferase-1
MYDLVVFGYDFPHQKTVEGLWNMLSNGFKPDMVYLQPYKELNMEQSAPIGVTHKIYPEPRTVCNEFGIPYTVTEHNNVRHRFFLGVVLGARILDKGVLDYAVKGVLNMHPGILPDLRNRDTIKWAIHLNLPQAVTLHYIDPRVDLGSIIHCAIVGVYTNDDLASLTERNMNMQFVLMNEHLWETLGPGTERPMIPFREEGVYRGTFPYDHQLGAEFKMYKLKYPFLIKDFTERYDYPIRLQITSKRG